MTAVHSLTILSAELAQSFLQRLGEHIEQNINIMNQEGIIIASRDTSRIGSYHDAAHRLIRSQSAKEEIEEQDDPAPGVKPGVNLPIQHRGETIGVVGVTGRPAEVRSLAYAVKISLETFMELEALRDKMLRQQAGMNRFIAKLLNPESMDDTSLHELARRTGYEAALPRTAILITLPPGMETEAGLRILKEQQNRSKQDILAATPQGDILLFKALGQTKGFSLGSWEEDITTFWRALQHDLPASQFYVSMMQKDVSRYHLAYREILWLKGHIHQTDNKPVMLYRHVMDLLTDPTLRWELVSLFEHPLEGIRQNAGGSLPHWLSETLLALVRADYAIQEAADRLHLHRNSLANRIKKINDLVGIDLITDIRWRDFFRVLAYFMNQTVHNAQQ